MNALPKIFEGQGHQMHGHWTPTQSFALQSVQWPTYLPHTSLGQMVKAFLQLEYPPFLERIPFFPPPNFFIASLHNNT